MTWRATDVVPDPADVFVPVTVADTPMVLVRLDDGWSAVEDRCGHAGCPFSTDGRLEDGRIVCDCHGSEFDPRTGAVLRPPAIRPVVVFAARVAPDGRLEVDR
jgi:3-phenylpropionate/trans-cinnamate dioxygenase ferredoxin subunit/naphthalene 1,2-dioxygenase system ferredoxin subunit